MSFLTGAGHAKSQTPRVHLKGPALDSLGICLVTPKVTTSSFSSAGSSGTTRGAGQEGEWLRGLKGHSYPAFGREERLLGSVPGPRMCPKGTAAPDPVFLLYQGDRGAPGELGEMGEKVRWCESRPALASPGVLRPGGVCAWGLLSQPSNLGWDSGLNCEDLWGNVWGEDSVMKREEGSLKPSLLCSAGRPWCARPRG